MCRVLKARPPRVFTTADAIVSSKSSIMLEAHGILWFARYTSTLTEQFRQLSRCRKHEKGRLLPQVEIPWQ